MKKTQQGHLSLSIRTFLFLAAFFVVLILQMIISRYQTVHIIDPMNNMVSEAQAVSQLLTITNETLSELDSYRWEFGDSSRLISVIERNKVASEEYLAMVQTDISSVSREQYILASANEELSKSFYSLLDELAVHLEEGNTEEASNLYYNEIVVCGGYLIDFGQKLIERILVDSTERSAAIYDLSQRFKSLQEIALVLTVIFGALFCIAVSTTLDSVRELAKSSKEISLGNFNTPDISEPGDEEIRELIHTFNEMKHSMKATVQLIEERSEMEKESIRLQNLVERGKLQMLRSQVNPHFLFNTINVIKLKSHEEGAYESEAMLGSLARLFRYALASNDTAVPLSQEIRVSEEFYALCKARFREKVNLSVEFSPEIDVTEVMVPSFIIQPVVENAFRHGLGPKETPGTVHIRIDKEGSLLKVVVSDDGVGMSAERLEEIKASLYVENSSGEHIGLQNIASRLRLINPECSIEIESRQDIGTKVTLLLEYVTETEEDEEESDDQDSDS